MQTNYLWGGTLAGLLALIALGLVLVQKRSAIRAGLAPYIGDRPAAWMLNGVGFVYLYGLTYAFSQAYFPAFQGGPEYGPPSAVSFAYGLIGRTLLWFFSAAVPALQFLALLAVAFMLYRHLGPAKASEAPGP